MHATSRTLVFLTDQSGVILRTALRILVKWKASAGQMSRILRVSRSTISRMQQIKRVRLDGDQLERASIVLNCHASLRQVFENPENVYGFMGLHNHNDFLMVGHRWKSWRRATSLHFLRHTGESTHFVGVSEPGAA